MAERVFIHGDRRHARCCQGSPPRAQPSNASCSNRPSVSVVSWVGPIKSAVCSLQSAINLISCPSYFDIDPFLLPESLQLLHQPLLSHASGPILSARRQDGRGITLPGQGNRQGPGGDEMTGQVMMADGSGQRREGVGVRRLIASRLWQSPGLSRWHAGVRCARRSQEVKRASEG